MNIRFFISQKIGKEDKTIVLSEKELVHQITNVFRMHVSGKIIILDNSGYEYKCEITQMKRDVISLDIIERIQNTNEPDINITLYQSIIKKDKMELVFEKCTEVGVVVFVPILSRYSVKLGFREDRAQKIVKEASEQSRRGTMPIIQNTLSFEKAIKDAIDNNGVNILLHNKNKNQYVQDFMRDMHGGSINIFIGPEGGFSDEEVAFAKENDFHILSLGDMVLRSETAAIVSTFLFS